MGHLTDLDLSFSSLLPTVYTLTDFLTKSGCDQGLYPGPVVQCPLYTSQLSLAMMNQIGMVKLLQMMRMRLQMVMTTEVLTPRAGQCYWCSARLLGFFASLTMLVALGCVAAAFASHIWLFTAPLKHLFFGTAYC